MPRGTSKQLAYSLDGKDFAYSSMAKLLLEMAQRGTLHVGTMFHVAEKWLFTVESLIDAGTHLVRIRERAASVFGDDYQLQFATAREDATAQLQVQLLAWANQHIRMDDPPKLADVRVECVTQSQIDAFEMTHGHIGDAPRSDQGEHADPHSVKTASKAMYWQSTPRQKLEQRDEKQRLVLTLMRDNKCTSREVVQELLGVQAWPAKKTLTALARQGLVQLERVKSSTGAHLHVYLLTEKGNLLGYDTDDGATPDYDYSLQGMTSTPFHIEKVLLGQSLWIMARPRGWTNWTVNPKHHFTIPIGELHRASPFTVATSPKRERVAIDVETEIATHDEYRQVLDHRCKQMEQGEFDRYCMVTSELATARRIHAVLQAVLRKEGSNGVRIRRNFYRLEVLDVKMWPGLKDMQPPPPKPQRIRGDRAAASGDTPAMLRLRVLNQAFQFLLGNDSATLVDQLNTAIRTAWDEHKPIVQHGPRAGQLRECPRVEVSGSYFILRRGPEEAISPIRARNPIGRYQKGGFALHWTNETWTRATDIMREKIMKPWFETLSEEAREKIFASSGENHEAAVLTGPHPV